MPDTRGRRSDSHYLKVRDRASFEFALVSAAVAMAGGERHDPGCAHRSRRCRHQALAICRRSKRRCVGKTLNDAALRRGGSAGGAGRAAGGQNGFKLTLLRRTVLRALQTVVA